jgi:hypothetical protein
MFLLGVEKLWPSFSKRIGPGGHPVFSATGIQIFPREMRTEALLYGRQCAMMESVESLSNLPSCCISERPGDPE